MDPVEQSVIKGAADCGINLSAVRLVRAQAAAASDEDCDPGLEISR